MHREQAADAKESAQQQADRADAATADATKAVEDAATMAATGRALRDAIEAKAENSGQRADQVTALLFGSHEPPPNGPRSSVLTTDVDELANLARRLFPD
ncbi:MAG: hypothetical protein U0Q07_18140 [Acidimicrobiales bacterium]